MILTVANDAVLETQHLRLRPPKKSDLPRFVDMYSNPKVMKYIYAGSVFSAEQAKNRLYGFVDHRETYGFGMWVLEEKSSNDIAGYAGFRYFDDDRPAFHQQIELGYIIDEPYWGKGYASEAVMACVDAGINQHNFSRILATILPENKASQKVAIKAGLKHTFDAEFSGLLHFIYEIKKMATY